MLKRSIFLLLITFIILSILSLKFMVFRPDLAARIVGKDFLLQSPMAKFIDVEKLYRYSEESIEVHLLNVQIQETLTSSQHPSVKDRTLSILKSKIDLLTGKREICSIDDAKLLFKVSEIPYTNLGIGNPGNSRFYYWEGPFSFIIDDYYFISYKKADISNAHLDKAIIIDGFALNQIRRWFTDSNLKPGTFISVVGRYTGTTELIISNNVKTKVPLLTDCYVDLKK